MENASKALIMAASVLIGIMILSLAVYLFATFGASSAQMHEQIQGYFPQTVRRRGVRRRINPRCRRTLRLERPAP